MPIGRERKDTSYVTLILGCGHKKRLVRENRPRNLRETVFCFECSTRTGITAIEDDKEWVIKCLDCRYRGRCGQSDVKAERLARTHFRIRVHTIEWWHENDPGVIRRVGPPTWQDEATKPRGVTEEDIPPF